MKRCGRQRGPRVKDVGDGKNHWQHGGRNFNSFMGHNGDTEDLLGVVEEQKPGQRHKFIIVASFGCRQREAVIVVTVGRRQREAFIGVGKNRDGAWQFWDRLEHVDRWDRRVNEVNTWAMAAGAIASPAAAAVTAAALDTKGFGPPLGSSGGVGQ